MKHLRYFAVLLVVSILAVPVFGATSVLTPDGIRYAVEPSPDRPQIQIGRAEGYQRATLVVPSTGDAVPESQVQLAYDAPTATLFVVWTRDNGAAGSEIRYATLNAEGAWSSPRNIAAGAGSYRGLQLALTRAEHGGSTATLMHLAWWSISGSVLDPEYALFAFEDGEVTADIENLVELANVGDGPTASDFEDTGAAMHPPLTMIRDGEGVDIAFGSVSSTSVTRLKITPRKIGGNVRMWRPVGRGGMLTPRVNLVSQTETPVQAFLINGRLALYSAADDFRFVVLRNDNTWSSVRSVHVDEKNTAADLAKELRDTVQQLIADEDEADTDSPATQ